MGTQYVPEEVLQGQQSTVSLNKNFNDIQTALVDSISRSGATPNQMDSTLDMNSSRIINLPPTPLSALDAVSKVYVDSLALGGSPTLEATQVTYDDTTAQTGNTTAQSALDGLDLRVDAIELGAPGELPIAANVTFDPSASGLIATDVQAAIDEEDLRTDANSAAVAINDIRLTDLEAITHVNSFFSRTGAVVPESSDYTAAQVVFDPSATVLTSINVQDALEEVAVITGVLTPGVEGSFTFPTSGLIIKWGTTAGRTTEGNTTHTFPVAFPTTCFNVIVGANSPSNLNGSDAWIQLTSTSATDFTIRQQSPAGSWSGSVSATYIAIGN